MLKKLIYLCASLFVLLTAGIAGAALMEGKRVADGIVYETATVTKGEIRRTVATSGTVRPRMTVQVGSEISGRVKSIVADFNVTVKSGDLLAIIEPKTFESKAKQAKADLLSAEAALVNSEAVVRKAQSVLTNADRVYGRQQALGRKGISSAANLDNSERDLSVARAEVDVARANFENAKAVVAQKLAQLDQAQIDLERTQIRAPISGVVLHRAIDVGQTVAASFQAPELFRLAGDLSSIHIEAQVSEADVGSVKRGQAVAFDVDAHPRRTFRGRVEQIRLSPSAAESVVTYTVIIEAENPKLELFPGMTANVRIETDKRSDVVRVATDAIRFKPPKQARVAAAEPSFWEKGLEFVRGQAGNLLGQEQPPAEAIADKAIKTTDGDSKEALVQRWTRRLKLDEKQVAELTERIRNIAQPTAAKKEAKTVKGKGRDRSDKEEDAISPFEQVLEQILTPDQRTRLAAVRKEREGTQRATVWVLTSVGGLEKRSVRVGLADVQNVELASTELRPGDEVIVRSKKAKMQ